MKLRNAWRWAKATVLAGAVAAVLALGLEGGAWASPAAKQADGSAHSYKARVPTKTPKSGGTVPTKTPKPTETPKPTKTPKSGNTVPTKTPKPTETPKPTKTPKAK